MINFIWGGILAFLILFMMFWNPGKAPAPKVVEAKPQVVVQPKVEEAPAPVATPDTVTVAQAAPSQELMDKGKRLYLSNCISCHNKDPNIKGSIGPELIDAPLELMRTKVVTGRYPEVLPPGFVPKRKTKVMTKFPKLGPDVDAIHAYVQSLRKK